MQVDGLQLVNCDLMNTWFVVNWLKHVKLVWSFRLLQNVLKDSIAGEHRQYLVQKVSIYKVCVAPG